MRSSTLPRHAGIGFKPEHFEALIAAPQPLGFIEVHAENYMGAGGPPHAQLTRLRQDHALSIHGVGLSIGGMSPLDRAHLERLRLLCARYEPESFSEHLAWSTHETTFYNDLLPLPYTEATLARVVEHIDEVQTVLKRRLLLENPATYLDFSESSFAETEFLSEIVARSGCGLLLDVNNVHVACTNRNSDPAAYLAAFPLAHVGEIHLGGHAVDVDETGAPLLIDAHDRAVSDPVWALYAGVIDAAGPLPTLIEWDNDVPSFPVLLSEAIAAEAIISAAAGAPAGGVRGMTMTTTPLAAQTTYHAFAAGLLAPEADLPAGLASWTVRGTRAPLRCLSQQCRPFPRLGAGKPLSRGAPHCRRGVFCRACPGLPARRAAAFAASDVLRR